MAGMAGPKVSDMGEGKEDFKMLYTYDGREPHCGRLKCNMLECSFVAVGSVYTEPVRMEEMLSTMVPNHLPLTIKFKSVACDGKHRLSSAGTPTPRDTYGLVTPARASSSLQLSPPRLHTRTRTGG